VGPSIELPLLASTDPSRPFNHSCEVTVAARNGVVVVASINLQLQSADSFGGSPLRRVAIHASTDHGRTFGEGSAPIEGGETVDPVVTALRDGSFVLSTLGLPSGGVLARSTDGASWNAIASGVPWSDKQWHAVDEDSQQIYVGGLDGYFRYGFDGALLGSHVLAQSDPQRRQMVDAYVDAAGAHFATTTRDVMRWDGAGAPVLERADFDGGSDATFFTGVAWSRGALSDGTWSVYARLDGGGGSIVVRLERGADVQETILTPPGANAFLPAATLDSEGRLHVIWYDSAGPTGVLRYARSNSAAPFADGFGDAIDVDPNATPGGFYPSYDSASGGRRLREYVGIAVDGELVHIAWTHAPAAPSRVYTATIRNE